MLVLSQLLNPRNSWDLVVVIGASLSIVAYIIRSVTDVMGWSPSQKTLRDANEDLRQRNTDLEKAQDTDRRTIAAQAETIKGHERRILELESQVRDMKAHDVTSLHTLMLSHEHNATNRAAQTQALLERIASALETPRT